VFSLAAALPLVRPDPHHPGCVPTDRNPYCHVIFDTHPAGCRWGWGIAARDPTVAFNGCIRCNIIKPLPAWCLLVSERDKGCLEKEGNYPGFSLLIIVKNMLFQRFSSLLLIVLLLFCSAVLV
ncbi:hypothetical protein XENOCAPTIV_022934, partial [Xenoophorus captivus]